ncbi:MAG: 2-amino-4-hydroxy-6-hydroxymethyldihydropteridine diphosphokinase [Bacteroidia bacterium]|nr:2-amino-4-hydroxy-6-hydroxymethyldihydropteridine diphosphokinase [Bacteroidia bacterium]
MAKIAFLGLGTNLGDKEENLKKAIENISAFAGEVISFSQIYETEPWGFRSEDHFFNMVIQIKTNLKPVDLLKQLLKIEIQMGRVWGSEKYSSRIIDIDILLYENEIINKPYLKVPHPMIQERKFVLVPLCDIAPEMIHPVLNKTFKILLEECDDESIVKKINALSFSPKGGKKSSL